MGIPVISNIFENEQDEQMRVMAETTAVGLTWQYRYLTVKWSIYCMVSAITSFSAAALADYTIIKTTEYSGLVGWALANIFG